MSIAFLSTPCALCKYSFISPSSPVSSRRPRGAYRTSLNTRRITPRAQQHSFRRGEAPDGSTITKMLEVSFRAVWIRLMTAGVGPEYEHAIQGFVVSCVAAYKAGYSITALKLELAANELQGTVQGRDVRLDEKEKETRLIWITLVYLTLKRYRFASERYIADIEGDLRGTDLDKILKGLVGLVENVCQAAEKGFDLNTWKMELRLKKNEHDKEISPAEASIRSQWSRIVFATVTILPDGLKPSKENL